MAKGRGRHPARIKIARPPETLLQTYLQVWRNGDLYRSPHAFRPLRGETLFDRPIPLVLDIGCATGELTLALAQRYPECGIVGVDVALKPLYRGIYAAAEQELCNLRFIRGDFTRMYHLLQPNTVKAVYLYFPVPAMKAREKKHAVLTTTFLKMVGSALIPEGTIRIKTDSREYFSWIENSLECPAFLECRRPAATAPADQDNLCSYYEALWTRQAREVWEIIFRRSF